MIEPGKFKCPICDTIHSIKNCKIAKQEISREFIGMEKDRENSTSRRFVYKENYLVKYYNIRICPKCAKKRKWHNIYAIIFVVLGIIALIIRAFLVFPEKSIFTNIFLPLVGGSFFGYFIYLILRVIIVKCQKIDIEKAKRYNAIEPVREDPFFF